MEILQIPDRINKIRGDQESKIIASIVYNKYYRPPDHVEYNRFDGIRLEWVDDYKNSSCSAVSIIDNTCKIFTNCDTAISKFRHTQEFNWHEDLRRLLNIRTEIELNYISTRSDSYDITRIQTPNAITA